MEGSVERRMLSTSARISFSGSTMSKTATLTWSLMIRYCTAVITLIVTLSLVLHSDLQSSCFSGNETGCIVAIGQAMQLKPGSFVPVNSPNCCTTPTLPESTHTQHKQLIGSELPRCWRLRMLLGWGANCLER